MRVFFTVLDVPGRRSSFSQRRRHTRSRTPTAGAPPTAPSGSKHDCPQFVRKLAHPSAQAEPPVLPELQSPLLGQTASVTHSPLARELHTQFGVFYAGTPQKHKLKAQPKYVGLTYKLRLDESLRKARYPKRRENLGCAPVLMQSLEVPGRQTPVVPAARYSLDEILRVAPAKLKLRPSKN